MGEFSSFSSFPLHPASCSGHVHILLCCVCMSIVLFYLPIENISKNPESSLLSKASLSVGFRSSYTQLTIPEFGILLRFVWCELISGWATWKRATRQEFFFWSMQTLIKVKMQIKSKQKKGNSRGRCRVKEGNIATQRWELFKHFESA